MMLRKRRSVTGRWSPHWWVLLAVAAVSVDAIATVAGAQSAANRNRRTAESRNGSGRKRPAGKIAIVKNGSSSGASLAAAKKLLPQMNVSPTVRKQIESILSSTSLYRELPSLRFEVDPRAYLYFAAHPDVAVSIWRAMGISKFKLTQQNTSKFVADGGDGTKGDIEIVFRGPGHVLVICNGVYKNPLLVKPVKTRSLVHLQATFHKAKSGRTYVTHRVFLYVAFPSMAVETAAKLLSPVSNMILDRNFKEISLFLHVMSQAMVKQPGWVEKIAARMDGVAQARKPELLKLTAQAYVDAQKRSQKQTGKPPIRTADLPPERP